jgi:hypothetical protein
MAMMATLKSAATPGKVVATVNASDVSLRTAKPAANCTTLGAAANRSTSDSAATHSAVEATACSAVEAAASAAVHPPTTAAATVTEPASHCWRSKSENESCRSDQFQLSHRILSYSGET